MVTVKELIEWLQQQNQDAEVFTYCGDFGYEPMQSLDELEVTTNRVCI